MAATVLNSSKAIETSVFVVRAFVRLRQLSLRHGELARRIADIENHITSNDKEIAALIKTVKAILRPTPIPPDRQIGFQIPDS